MHTVKQLERLWESRRHRELLSSLLNGRVEAPLQFFGEMQEQIAAAAMIVIRLDELSQAHAPLASRMIRFIVGSQEADGGWHDPATSALAIRALLCSGGRGDAIHRGIQFLCRMQRDDGIWSDGPIRRLASDPLVSAFILLQLGKYEPFRSAVRFDDAIEWFTRHQTTLEQSPRAMWQQTAARHRPATQHAMASPIN